MNDAPRRKRRLPVRWVTLGEAVALAAVAISGLGLYNSWQDRRSAAVAPAPAAGPLLLRASAEREGARLALRPAAAAQSIQNQTIAFPSALKVAPIETSGKARIEAGWIEDPLGELIEDMPKVAGDRQLPILLITRYLEGTAERRDTSIYQLGYTAEGGGLFGGTKLRLRGLALDARGPANGQQRIDAMWRQRSTQR